MPTNEQRRAAAKRKLQRRNERQVLRVKRRKQIMIFSAIGVVVIALAVVGIVYWNKHEAKVEAAQLAAYKAATCEYKANKEEASQLPKGKNVGLPPNPNPKPKTGTVAVTLNTTAGPIPITMKRAEAPCTVQSLAYLVEKKFYDNVKCHRETNSSTPMPLKVLQCGDPTGTGGGGPGYTSPDELPKNLKTAPLSPQLMQQVQQSGSPTPVVYPRGSIAMANSGPNSNGSQFFLVYGDSYLPPNYNLFGTISPEGLATLDKIAKAGITPGTDPQTGQPTPNDGPPKKPVTITTAGITAKS